MSRIQSYNAWKTIDGDNGYSQLTVGAAAVGIGSVPKNTSDKSANAVLITITANAATTSNAVKLRLDGADATTVLGTPLKDGAVIELFGDELVNASLISADGNDQTVDIEWAITS